MFFRIAAFPLRRHIFPVSFAGASFVGHDWCKSPCSLPFSVEVAWGGDSSVDMSTLVPNYPIGGGGAADWSVDVNDFPDLLMGGNRMDPLKLLPSTRHELLLYFRFRQVLECTFQAFALFCAFLGSASFVVPLPFFVFSSLCIDFGLLL